MKFDEVLNKYIDLINCSSKDLASSSNLSESIISRYRNGNRIPTQDKLKLISAALSSLSNNKYSTEEILQQFNNSIKSDDLDFEIIKKNLNTIITSLNINARELAKYLNFDASYLSKIRNGDRIPSNKKEFVHSLSNFILKKYYNENDKNLLCALINKEGKINLVDIENWITTNNKEENNIDHFLKKLNNFDLNDYIKAIKFDELKIPNIPFYRAKSKTYYGIEEMKQGELDFFKATVLSKSKEDIFMCSDMPMEDMAKDVDFGKKWMFAIAMSLKKGLHLNIIHNLDRPFNEMMLGLESWMPIYMTGQVSPFYLSENKTVYNHLNYVSGAVVLAGECIKGFHNDGKYQLITNDKEKKYYKLKAQTLLKKANPLMEIYREENQNQYKTLLLKDVKINADRKRIFSSLPLFTIDNELLIKILKRNKLSEKEINKILLFKKEEEENIKLILKNNKINDIIYKAEKDNWKNDVYLSLENIFISKKIKYNYDEYLQHFNSTIEYKNKNYTTIINNEKIFDSITITILKDHYVTISKQANPIIHFVIKHPKLINAINNFNPLVKE